MEDPFPGKALLSNRRCYMHHLVAPTALTPCRKDNHCHGCKRYAFGELSHRSPMFVFILEHLRLTASQNPAAEWTGRNVLVATSSQAAVITPGVPIGSWLPFTILMRLTHDLLSISKWNLSNRTMKQDLPFHTFSTSCFSSDQSLNCWLYRALC
jgi:hypothetical protein